MASKNVPTLETQCLGLTNNPVNAARWQHLYPNDIRRARRFFTNRRRQPELVKAGVLLRIEKELVVMVPAYLAWLARHAQDVTTLGPKLSCNTPQHAAKRFGAARRERVQEPDGI